MAFLLNKITNAGELKTFEAGEEVTITPATNAPHKYPYFASSRRGGGYRETSLNRHEFVTRDEYLSLMPNVTLLLYHDGTCPGVVKEIDVNGMVWIEFYKWGFDHPDWVTTWWPPDEARKLIITPDECRKRFGGLPPNWGKRA